MNAVAYPPGVNRYKLVLVTDYSDLVPSGSDLVQHGLTNCISKSVEKCLDDILREHGLMMGKTDTAGSKYGRIKCNCRLDRLTCRSVEAFLEYRNAMVHKGGAGNFEEAGTTEEEFVEFARD